MPGTLDGAENRPGQEASGPEEPMTITEIAEQQKKKERKEAEDRLGVSREQKESAADPTKETEKAKQAAEQSIEDEAVREQEHVSEKDPSGEGPGGKKPPAGSNLPKDLQDDVFLKEFLASDQPQQVKSLVVIAFKKGVKHAIDLAKSSKDPYLLDIFHDALVDELYGHLVDKKKLKKE